MKTKTNLNGVYRRNWKGRYVYAAYSNGKLKAWTNVKGSKTNINILSNTFKANRTFNINIERKETKLTNFQEVLITRPTSFTDRETRAIKRDTSKIAQYHISGTFKGKLIIARSHKFGGLMSRNAKDMKQRAWVSFLELLSQANGGDYDADEGYKLKDKVTNVREGWVYYKK